MIRLCVARADWDALLDAAATPQERAILALLLGCGLRSAELLALTGGDVRADRLFIRHPQDDRCRTVPLPPHVRLPESVAADQPFFRMTQAELARIVREAGERVGYPDLTPHDLRHSFALDLLEQR